MHSQAQGPFPVWLPGNPWRRDYMEGCIIAVYKPLHKTSFQMVAEIKCQLKKMKYPKIKVGHAGTLDPLADGVLVLCVGRATKVVNQIQHMEKTYRARIVLGATRPSYDKETEIDREYPWQHIDADALYKQAREFLGDQWIHPPIHSAVKIGGIRSYKLARRGENPVLQAKPVVIYALEIVAIQWPAFECLIRCSKGTYIRSLAHEFGQRLGSGAYLDALTRTAVGHYDLSKAWSLAAIVDELRCSQLHYL